MVKDFKLSCVLFDLDGTLIDTAPDLISSMNNAFSIHGLEAVSPNSVKPYISFGAAAMINEGLKDAVNAKELKQKIFTTMLDHYQANIARYSVFFDGIVETLNLIETNGLKWGVVTNKKERFTLPLMKALKLNQRVSCLISGDTTAFSKPHQEPMLTACRQANVQPQECVFIGDAQHDIEAGKNVKMKTLAALYGYLKSDDLPATWGADAMVETPEQISDWIIATLCP